ncbi:MAG TPA: 2-oxoacid:ferredoxin oxidoreductase subunit beta [Anaerolineae bacterium]|nr:2-oxoacid:ferredoxin oxidoreductase subunit beta [Anaerolineae bacterium]
MNDTNGKQKKNRIGLTRTDYFGEKSTLCKGCGHNSISNMIITACFEMDIIPEKIVKFSGIGCSSKSPNYFLNRSFGFNGLHGRMPSLAVGALFADISLKGIGISGDGDTANIGLSQFKHLVRRNMPMVYIVENNGVYGLTKGQFSATAEKGLSLKRQGENIYLPVDIAMEALAANATFIARSFAGDPKQVKELLKAALSHKGTAVIDIISPCVTFNNQEKSLHSYSWGKGHEAPLHELEFVPPRDEITIEDFEKGTIREVVMHDGAVIILKKLDKDYDPTNRSQAVRMLEEAIRKNWLVTGLIYIDPEEANMVEMYDLDKEPLNRIQSERLRPSRDSLYRVNDQFI